MDPNETVNMLNDGTHDVPRAWLLSDLFLWATNGGARPSRGTVLSPAARRRVTRDGYGWLARWIEGRHVALDLTTASTRELQTLDALLWRNVRRALAGGLQYGIDWATLRATMPVRAAFWRAVRAELASREDQTS